MRRAQVVERPAAGASQESTSRKSDVVERRQSEVRHPASQAADASAESTGRRVGGRQHAVQVAQRSFRQGGDTDSSLGAFADFSSMIRSSNRIRFQATTRPDASSKSTSTDSRSRSGGSQSRSTADACRTSVSAWPASTSMARNSSAWVTPLDGASSHAAAADHDAAWAARLAAPAEPVGEARPRARGRRPRRGEALATAGGDLSFLDQRAAQSWSPARRDEPRRPAFTGPSGDPLPSRASTRSSTSDGVVCRAGPRGNGSRSDRSAAARADAPRFAEPGPFEQQPAESRMDRQPGQRAAEFCQPVIAYRAEPLEQVKRLPRPRVRCGGSSQGNVSTLLAEREQVQRRPGEIDAADLRLGLRRPRAVRHFAPQSDADARLRPPGPAGPLVGRGARDVHQLQPVQADRRVVDQLPGQAGVDDGGDALDRDRRLGHVRRQHDLARGLAAAVPGPAPRPAGRRAAAG